MKPTETIVITGASRGIGAAIACRLAHTGRRLVLLARSEHKLAELCAELRAKGAEAEYIKADLSTVDLAAEAASQITDRCERIDTLVLNAGMANDALFNDTTVDDIAYELGVNYLAPVTLLHSLMPQIEVNKFESSKSEDRESEDRESEDRESEDSESEDSESEDKPSGGHVVIVGSLTALLPYPSNATYSASKAALLALVRSLRVEMDDSGVHFGIVLPGSTKTSMTEGKSSFIPSMDADDVAKAVEKCIEEREGVVIPGLTNRLAATFFQEFPGLGERLLKPLKKRIVPGFDGYHKS